MVYVFWLQPPTAIVTRRCGFLVQTHVAPRIVCTTKSFAVKVIQPRFWLFNSRTGYLPKSVDARFVGSRRSFPRPTSRECDGLDRPHASQPATRPPLCMFVEPSAPHGHASSSSLRESPSKPTHASLHLSSGVRAPLVCADVPHARVLVVHVPHSHAHHDPRTRASKSEKIRSLHLHTRPSSHALHPT